MLFRSAAAPPEDISDRGYDAQSEDDSEEEAPRRHQKRFTRRARPPLGHPSSTGSPPDSSQSSTGYGSNIERSDSGHALFYDAELKAWRRNEAAVRRRRTRAQRLAAEELTDAVRDLHRTPSGTPAVYDRKRGCWRRDPRPKTVNYDALTAAQQEAKQTASGTAIYYDSRRLEWRRRRRHASDVPDPSAAQVLLKRTASGSAMIYDDVRQVWKRKLKRSAGRLAVRERRRA
ncbi:uncharacterized protein LOC119103612 [Pollicipes pollicipes]|uniref:uncharacterized protein LOC119103612 n=1 Tax=Pollicipes pollicipes TaxID=41117 RepID=UPI0018854C51|nr:uncharacterized protein LOC119103612 [Pollicipes pollicipes]